MFNRKMITIPIDVLLPGANFKPLADYCRTKGMHPVRWSFPVDKSAAELANLEAIKEAIRGEENLDETTKARMEQSLSGIGGMIAGLAKMAEQGLILDKKQMRQWAKQMCQKRKEKENA